MVDVFRFNNGTSENASGWTVSWSGLVSSGEIASPCITIKTKNELRVPQDRDEGYVLKLSEAFSNDSQIYVGNDFSGLEATSAGISVKQNEQLSISLLIEESTFVKSCEDRKDSKENCVDECSVRRLISEDPANVCSIPGFHGMGNAICSSKEKLLKQLSKLTVHRKVCTEECQPECDQVRYDYLVSRGEGEPGIFIFAPNSDILNFGQIFNYSPSQMFAEFVGSMGFFFGISVLTAFEFLHDFIVPYFKANRLNVSPHATVSS